MARIFMAGNEHLDYRADGFTSYAAVTTSYQAGINQIGPPYVAWIPGYTGGRGAFVFQANTGIVHDFTPDFPAGLSEVYIRFHLNGGYAMTNTKVLMRFLDANDAVTHELRIADFSGWNNFANGHFQLQAYRGDIGVNYVNTGGLFNGRGFNISPPWLIEFHLKIDATTGQVEWRTDGYNNGGVFNGNTLGPAGQTNFKKMVLCYITLGGNNNYYSFDDLVVNDTTGTINNSWPGDGYIMPLDAIADSTDTPPQLSNAYGTSINNYAHVNRFAFQGSLLNNGTAYNAGNPNFFVGTNTPNNKDLYKLGTPMPEFFSVKSLDSSLFCTRNGPAITRVKHLFKPPLQAEISTPVAGNLLPVGQFDYVKSMPLEINPNTGQPFTIAELQAMEAGIQFIA